MRARTTNLAQRWYDAIVPVAQGDAVVGSTTFDGAVRAHEAVLRAVATRLCRNAADAADLVQDTLERALKRFDRLVPDSNVRSWLLMILHHRFIDLCRTRARHPRETPLEGHDAAVVPDEPLAWANISEYDVRAAVAKLPDDLRVAYELRIYDHRSYDDIASLLGIATMTVGTRLLRARRRLRELLVAAPTTRNP
jgi:RNA polymerase sigma-70 factor, ECF subfamily